MIVAHDTTAFVRIWLRIPELLTAITFLLIDLAWWNEDQNI